VTFAVVLSGADTLGLPAMLIVVLCPLVGPIAHAFRRS
jgi:hypothetical protein